MLRVMRGEMEGAVGPIHLGELTWLRGKASRRK